MLLAELYVNNEYLEVINWILVYFIYFSKSYTV
jgi:hypothetical protein